MKIKTLIIILFNLTFASLVIGYIIYQRLFVIRLPKELYFFDNGHLKLNLVLFTTLSIIFCLANLIAIILFLRNKQTTNIFTQLSLKANTIVEQAFSDLYNFICNFIPNIYDKVSYLSQKFYVNFHEISETLFLFIQYGIRLIILFFFILDVFIFFKLNYMYKVLYLLCISMLIKLLFYILKDFSANLEEARSYLIITDLGIDRRTHLPRTNYKLKEEYNHLDLEYHIGQYILCLKVSGYLDMYQRYSNFFYPYVNSIIYSFYLIGWIYVILYNFCF